MEGTRHRSGQSEAEPLGDDHPVGKPEHADSVTAEVPAEVVEGPRCGGQPGVTEVGVEEECG